MRIKIKGSIYNFAPKSVNIKIGDMYGNMIKDTNDQIISVVVGIAMDEESCKFHNESEDVRLLFNIENDENEN
jgi:hypothetical protein